MEGDSQKDMLDMLNDLQEMRRDGHSYIEIKEDGIKWMFHCVLCSRILKDANGVHRHLGSDIHQERLEIENSTLLKENPWPFNDGIFFFYEHPKDLEIRKRIASRSPNLDYDACAIHLPDMVETLAESSRHFEVEEGPDEISIPGVSVKGELIDVVATHTGVGVVGARRLKEVGSSEVKRLWVEWIGKKPTPVGYDEHEFAIVTFTYEIGLGRADPVHDKPCSVCNQNLLLCKDVATLFNRTTGKLVCSSRNLYGAFHLCHVSCLLNWVLFCEAEIYASQQQGSNSSISGTGEKQENKINSLMCPDCEGTGINIDAQNYENLEKFPFFFAELKKFKIRLNEAREKWMKSPEVLEHCTIGLCIANEMNENEETVEALKWLDFYHVAPMTAPKLVVTLKEDE